MRLWRSARRRTSSRPSSTRPEREHEILRITRHGHSAAVLMAEDDLESLHETIFWLSQPGIREDVADARTVS